MVTILRKGTKTIVLVLIRYLKMKCYSEFFKNHNQKTLVAISISQIIIKRLLKPTQQEEGNISPVFLLPFAFYLEFTCEMSDRVISHLAKT